MVAVPDFSRLVPALGLVPDLAVVPHFDEIPRRVGDIGERLAALVAGKTLTVAGIDGGTALVVAPAGWEVTGNGGVTLFGSAQTRRYLAQQEVALPHQASGTARS
ncbi:MAG: hypothetical protein M1401_12120 [Chloroflexi bacterium]|nr:hypothetical protein [Chloroflexota bacterium]